MEFAGRRRDGNLVKNRGSDHNPDDWRRGRLGTARQATQAANGQRRILLDLSGVDFISNAGLRAILLRMQEIRKQGGDLRLA